MPSTVENVPKGTPSVDVELLETRQDPRWPRDVRLTAPLVRAWAFAEFAFEKRQVWGR
jgi:hypothetical protein